MKMMMNKVRMMCVAMAMIAVTVFVVSCSDDEGDPKNNFKIDGKVIGIKTALFSYDESPGLNEQEEEYYRHELTLLSSGFTVSGTGISGSGDAISLSINGGTEDLDAGTYEFTGTEENPAPFQVWDAWVYLDIPVDGSPTEEYEFTSGELIISKSGSTYTIELTGVAGGKAVTAKYVGSVTSLPKDL